MISDGMRGTIIGAKEERAHRQVKLVHYLYDSLHMHNTYAFGYFLCEALNFINVVSKVLKLFFHAIVFVYFKTKQKKKISIKTN